MTRVRDGRLGTALLRLAARLVKGLQHNSRLTHSATAGRFSEGESTIISSGDCIGVGDGSSICETVGALRGSGVMSIMSLDGSGDEDAGRVGVVVVAYSAPR